MDFNTQLQKDLGDVFIQEFSQVAIFESTGTVKEVKIQFFEESLDSLDSTYFHAWCDYNDVCDVRKNDKLTINNVTFGIVDYTPDEFKISMNLFLQKV